MPMIFAVARAVPEEAAFAALVTIALATIAGGGGVVGAVHGVALVILVRANALAQDSP